MNIMDYQNEEWVSVASSMPAYIGNFNKASCLGICGLIGRAAACGALCRGFDPCWRRRRGVAVDLGPEQSGWLINQLHDPSFDLIVE